MWIGTVSLTSRRTMPSERSCCPMLNWFWVIPTSAKKKSVKAFPLREKVSGRKEEEEKEPRAALTYSRDPFEARRS